MPKDLNDPTLKHGTQRGYNLGCRKDSPCPATPTCYEFNVQKQAAYRARRRKDAVSTVGIPQHVHIARRLRDTIAKVGVEQVLEYTGLTAATVEDILTPKEPRTHVDVAVATPINRAWAWFLYGKDPFAPGVVHGESRNYSHGCCRCTECCTAHVKAQKKAKAGILTAHSRVPSTVATQHVKHLLAQPDVSVRVIGRAANVNLNVISKIARGEGHIKAKVARTVLALTVEKVSATKLMVSNARSRELSGRMWALGYPRKWQAEQMGVDLRILDQLNRCTSIRVENAEKIEALAARLGDRAAVPTDTLSETQIKRARMLANKAGYYPPAYYDDDGNLDVRSLPTNQWTRVDERCTSDFPVARGIARAKVTRSEIARECGVTTKQVDRIAKKLRLRAIYDGDGSRIHPDDADRAQWVIDLLDAYEAGHRGPVEVALTLGLRARTLIPAAHPEMVAMAAAEAQDTDEDVAA